MILISYTFYIVYSDISNSGNSFNPPIGVHGYDNNLEEMRVSIYTIMILIFPKQFLIIQVCDSNDYVGVLIR